MSDPRARIATERSLVLLVNRSGSIPVTSVSLLCERIFQKFIVRTIAERSQTTVIMPKRALNVGTYLQQSVRKCQKWVIDHTDSLVVESVTDQ